MSNETKYRVDIQVLRGIAVLAVVLFHSSKTYFPNGYLGVDIFFVISGFVVMPLILRIFNYQANGGLFSNLRFFYKRRFYRLAPALAATLTISTITLFFLGPIVDHERFVKQGIATLLLAGNAGAYKYSGDYFSNNPNPLVHTWSLSVEEQIYIVLPLFLILFLHKRRRLKKITAVVLGFILVTSFLSFLSPTVFQPLYSFAGIQTASQFSFYSPIERIWEFSLGSLGFLLLNRYQSYKWKASKIFNFLAVIAMGMILFSPIHIGQKTGSVFASLLAVAVIALKSLDVLLYDVISRLEWLGDRSYSIYLVHMPLLYLAKYSPVTQIGDNENRMIQSVAAVVFSIFVGALSYSKIENRYRNKGKGESIKFKTISISAILTLAIPLTFFVIMDQGIKQQYWGLDKNISRPIYAGTLDSKCLRDSETGPPCVYTNAGAAKTVLLIGDSHAGHISQAVVDAAYKTNWNAVIWTHGGCHVQFQRNISGEVSDNCISVNNQMKNWVLVNKPDAIIVSEFVKSNSSQKDLRDALQALQSVVPKILLIENNPIFPDERDFMVAGPLAMPAYQPPKSFKLSEMQMKDRMASDQLANWARKNSISTMNFESLFCTKMSCTRYEGSDWLYRDADHFSVAGAKLTIPQLRAFLKEF